MIKNNEGMEKWEMAEILVFPRVYLVGRIEKQMDGKVIYLVEEKSENEKCSLYKFTIMSLII